MSLSRAVRRQRKKEEVQSVRKRRSKLLFEPLEPRLLLSADLDPKAAAALGDGLGQLGDRVESFLSGEDLLDTRIPFILQVQKVGEDVESVAPSLGMLFSIPVHFDNTISLDTIAETKLYNLDLNYGNNDGIVNAGEFLQGWFFQKAKDFGGATTDSYKFYLENLDDVINLPGGTSIKFDVIDVIDLTPVIDTDTAAGEVAFAVTFNLTVEQDLAIDLGLEADALKILPFKEVGVRQEPPAVPVTASLDFGFTFVVNTGGQDPLLSEGDLALDSADFFVRSADNLIVTAKSDKSVVTL